ncbi:MAG: hypothetical protein WDW21_06360, partial [Neisseriaceae bacterium]
CYTRPLFRQFYRSPLRFQHFYQYLRLFRLMRLLQLLLQPVSRRCFPQMRLVYGLLGQVSLLVSLPVG